MTELALNTSLRRFVHRPKKSPGGRGDAFSALLFLSPTLVIFTTFILFPVFFSFYLSFQHWNMFSADQSFVGLENYIRLFQSPEFWQVLKNTLVLHLLQYP